MQNLTQQQTKLILEHTGMTDEDLFYMRVDNAKVYMKDILQLNEMGIEILMSSKLFFDWWLSLWSNRDSELILSCEFTELYVRYSQILDIPMMGGATFKKISFLNPVQFKALYDRIHNPYIINNFPHNKIIEDTYMQMTHKMVKDAVAPAYK
jgi:hypothetical protein